MNTQRWQHDHIFGQDQKRSGEHRTLIVIVMTSLMMAIEIIAGFMFGSIALLADGLHMASHATALFINLYAYIYARRHAYDSRFSFGTGKVNALGGFTGAVLLGVFALMMAWGSIERMIHPVDIAFNQAILVALIGLVVNGASVFILGNAGGHAHGHDHHHYHGDDHQHDHNLKSAYYHVLADALTSVLAIFALLLGKYFGLVWMDPLMGIVGSILVFKWSIGLLKVTSGILLDHQGSQDVQDQIKESIEKAGENRVVDLHIWKIGSNIYSAILTIVSPKPERPEFYKKLLPASIGIEHITVEVIKSE